MAIELGTGTTLVDAGGFAPEYVEVTGNENDSVPIIQSSHMGTTGYHTKIAGDIKDGGSFNLTVHFTGAQNPTIGGTPSTKTIDWGGTGKTWAFPGVWKSFTPAAPLEDKMTATAVLEVCGTITKVTS